MKKRLIKLVDDLSSNPLASIPVACQGWAETKAAYRLLDNEAVDWHTVLSTHGERSESRMADHKRVLCLQDTTELDFTSQPGIAGLGRLSYERQHGMYVHPTLAVTPDGIALGVLDAWMWAREPVGEEALNEGVRWLEGYERVAECAKRLPETRLIYVADREGDIRALMDRAAKLEHPADWLIRAQHDRVLAEDDEKLMAKVAAQTALGTVEFQLPSSETRESRKVVQQIRVARLTLAAKGGETRDVTVILAQEDHPPAGEEVIRWVLLTNELITTLEEACERVGWYRRRWLIEIFFRILKSGCRVEALQLAHVDRLERALVIYMIVAWRILHLVTLGRECPQLPCDVMFDAEEWRTAWIVAKRQRPPETPPALGEMIRIVATFGGFLGRKCDGHPGPKALWEGLQQLMAYVETARSFSEVYGFNTTCG